MLVRSFIPFDVSLVSFNIESEPHVSWLIVMNITISFNGDIDDNNLGDDYNDDDEDGDKYIMVKCLSVCLSVCHEK